jgi:hypothetical protein
MRRHPLLLLALLVLPAGAAAQPALLIGGGFSSPFGDFADVADPGYHLTAGVEVGLPQIPVAIRLDGSYHRLPAASSSFTAPRVLGGAIDVVFQLPGQGIEPYAFGGIGRYRVTAGPAGFSESEIDRGFQAGFGVNLGSIAFGAFAEIRYVQIGLENGTVKYIPLSIGFRL